MPRYMDTAAEANVTAKELLELVPPAAQPTAACLIAKLFNYGLRCAPRAVQSTVRLNAVRRAVHGLPVAVVMNLVEDPTTGHTFHALLATPKG